jgi:hypothetical protein
LVDKKAYSHNQILSDIAGVRGALNRLRMRVTNAGFLHYSGPDGTDYGTAYIISHASNGGSGQTINSTSFSTINSLSIPVGIGIYKFRVEVDLTTAAAAGQWELALTAPAVSTVSYKFFWDSGGGVGAGAVNQSTITTVQKGPNPSVIGPYWATYSGIVRFTAAGTFAVTAATTVGADTFTVWDSSTIELKPFG